MRPDTTADKDDPLRPVALVVAMLAAVIAGVVIVVQLSDGDAESILTLPLLIAVPAAFALIYWYYKHQ